MTCKEHTLDQDFILPWISPFFTSSSLLNSYQDYANRSPYQKSQTSSANTHIQYHLMHLFTHSPNEPSIVVFILVHAQLWFKFLGRLVPDVTTNLSIYNQLWDHHWPSFQVSNFKPDIPPITGKRMMSSNLHMISTTIWPIFN